MSMQRYETLILAVPEITNDESNEIEKAFDKKVRELGGSIVSYDRWGKFQVAYPIRRNDYGVYYLARFEIPQDKAGQMLHGVDELFAIRFHDVVMRHMNSMLAADASPNYKRPLSLEETPREGDFLKGGRMGYGHRSGAPRSMRADQAQAVAAVQEAAITEPVAAEPEQETSEQE